MKKLSLVFKMLFLVITLFFFTQCQKDGLKPEGSLELSEKVSSRSATISEGTFDFIATSYCTENIKVKGTYQFVFSDVISAGGKVSFQAHLNAHGTGIGVKSGAKYKWADNWNSNFNFSLVNGQLHETTKYYTRMIGTGNATDVKIIENYLFAFNANGELVAKDGSYSIDCN